MSFVSRALTRAAHDLRQAGADFALIGAIAVSLRCDPARTTLDVDFAVAVADDRGAESIVARMREKGYSIREVLEEKVASRLATVRLISPLDDPSGIYVDLLFASTGIEDLVVANADELEVFPRMIIPVAKLGHLLALKVLANRPQDQMDGARLILAASDTEMRRAREALDLIAARGYAREEGRDLQAELTRWIERAPQIA